ncbi:hypothetical protein FXO38_02055 [Capsicum annuum]|nr:hypothetical protein FXO38_02055 [Capsicum annuum]KAF3682947.1 hypothetical protein FXO37_02090 [Capsicum annuum]
MFVTKFVMVVGDFMEEWVYTPRGWKWKSFTKLTLPIAVRRNSSYDELVASIKQSGDLDCASSNVVISYLMHSREKVNPTIINNDARVSLYMMDVDVDGFRTVLRINVVDRSFEGPMNSSPSPLRFPTVDDNLNDYESDGDHPMNMADDCVHMEDVSSDSQVVEEDYEMGSQPVHFFLTESISILKSIVEDEPDLCVISDRHISISNAFSRVYSRACHGICMRHLAKNLCVNQHCAEHIYLFYATEKEYSFDEFSKNFKELKYNCPEAAHVLENVLGFEKWSRAHFLGNRYDVMTENIAELLKSILMDEREYPVSEQYAYVDGKENIFVPCAEKILRDNKSESDSLYVTNQNGVLNQYTVFGNGVTAKVMKTPSTSTLHQFIKLYSTAWEKTVVTWSVSSDELLVFSEQFWSVLEWTATTTSPPIIPMI